VRSTPGWVDGLARPTSSQTVNSPSTGHKSYNMHYSYNMVSRLGYHTSSPSRSSSFFLQVPAHQYVPIMYE